ncbi:hypothetical protein AB7849_14805 [Rhodanobacter sp. 115]|nr:hypothetical protein [Rhodanobacter sp. 115]
MFSLNAGCCLDAYDIDDLYDKTHAEHLNAAREGLIGHVNTGPDHTVWP